MPSPQFGRKINRQRPGTLLAILLLGFAASTIGVGGLASIPAPHRLYGCGEECQKIETELAAKTPKLLRRTGKVELEYIDREGSLDFLEDKDALCNAAGCGCDGPGLTCGHTEGFFYEPLFARVYANMCFHTCYCDVLPAADGRGVVANVGDIQIVQTEQQGSRVPENSCLSNSSAGWTLESLAPRSCCPGTAFAALSTQEAYTRYKVTPTWNEIRAESVTIGICSSKTTS
ncbi:MAG: hypothetical protein Q9220_001937 [cf. Caloplaca sp. 1 TL-2023]